MFLINQAMESVGIGTAAVIVVLGMAVVFFGLILLMLVTKATGKIMSAQEKKKEADVPGEWLYLAPETVGVRQIADVLEGTCEMEIWQEAGVLEIMYGGEASMDMEEGKIHPRDQVTAVFAEEHGCNRVYLVTFSAEEYEKVLPVMRHILQECGGIFCGDTEDFKPILTE